MKSFTINFAMLLLLCFGFTVTSLSQTIKEAKFTVSSGDLIDVSLRQGNININIGSVNEVKILAKNIKQDELDLLKMEQKSSTVEIKFKGEDSENFELELTIPAALDLNLKTGGGNISIKGDLTGKTNATTGGGNITTENINGSVDVSTGGGNIKTGNINGSADISTGGGDLNIGDINGIADIKTAGGNIKIGNVGGRADIKTAGGNIFVEDIGANTAGGNSKVSTAGGNIAVKNVSGNAEINTAGGNLNLVGATGKVEANTAGGNIKLENIKGYIDANTAAGNIYAELYPEGDVKSELNTAVGNITLKVPEDTKATIVATFAVLVWSGDDSDLDNIKSDFAPNEIKRNKEKKQIEVVYQLNGGGPTIEINVAMGEIEIRKLK